MYKDGEPKWDGMMMPGSCKPDMECGDWKKGPMYHMHHKGEMQDCHCSILGKGKMKYEYAMYEPGKHEMHCCPPKHEECKHEMHWCPPKHEECKHEMHCCPPKHEECKHEMHWCPPKCSNETMPACMLLAHAYVPWQFYHEAFSPREALHKGTLFPELYGVYVPPR